MATYCVLCVQREWTISTPFGSPRQSRIYSRKGTVKTEILEAAGNQGVLALPEVQQLRESLEAAAVLEHARVPFPSFPYEWAPDMLRGAALLTLDMAAQLLDDGMGLKDATPYNVLFDGPVPIFVDLLSIERRVADDPIWIAYAQFIRTFVLPLMANRYFDSTWIRFSRPDGTAWSLKRFIVGSDPCKGFARRFSL